jgi:hypothetical protein
MACLKKRKSAPGEEDLQRVTQNKIVRMIYKKSFSSEVEYITFYSKSANARARLLSNFFSRAVCIDFSFLGGQHVGFATYPSGEHAFHGGKFKIISAQLGVSSARHAELLDHSRMFEGATVKDSHYLSASDAKKAGGKTGIRLTGAELQKWDIHSMLLQEQICRDKLKNPEVLQFLLSTTGRYLIHNERATGWPRYGAMVLTAQNSPYSDGMRWMKGDNLLGEMWVTLRVKKFSHKLLWLSFLQFKLVLKR